VFAVVLTLAAALPAAAPADGDPASDGLLGENVFYPYSPAVSPSVQKSLNATTAAAKRAGFPIKVALIASPVDLGVIPDLFGKPQKYATFLDQEISFRGKQPLLVVMPAGYGVQGLSPTAKSAVATLPKPASKQGDALATAAQGAVRKLAEVSGHPISAASQNGSSSSSSGGGGSSSTPVIIFAIAAVIAAGALATITLRRRRAGPASR
jgi:MYXO-CTERM domain-containing protein